MLTDLDEAERLLKLSDPCVENGLDDSTNQDNFLSYRQLRLNFWAVKALKARVYLYTGDTAKAYQEAKAIIDAKDNSG
ncbi:MAG: hypothetical protein IJK09_03460 [Prevotella sp.]|nr:hypothetical protein [Prevotella sp.]